MHVLPPWVGDTNFMTVAGESRVLPESLEETCERLKGERWVSLNESFHLGQSCAP
jgi:diadenosine tetraphosphate (Ap4A) HIT family hydrolase